MRRARHGRTRSGRAITGDQSGILAPRTRFEILLDGEDRRAQGEYHLVMASHAEPTLRAHAALLGTGAGRRAIHVESLRTLRESIGRAAVGLLRGKPADWVTPENWLS